MGNWGEVVKKIREDKQIEQQELAAAIGVTQGYMSKIESGKIISPKIKLIKAIAKRFDITPEQLSNAILNETSNISQGEYATVKIPLLGSVPAGYPFSETEDTTGDYIEVSALELEGVDPKKVFALRISGNSLIGDGIENQDNAIVERNAPLIDGKIYVVRIGNEVVARHVYKHNDHLRLISTNGSYSDIKAIDVEILGRIILAGRYKRF